MRTAVVSKFVFRPVMLTSFYGNMKFVVFRNYS